MRYEIRPMSFGEILDAGFRLLRNHFVILVGLALPIYTPLAFVTHHLSLASVQKPPDPGNVALLALATLLLISLTPIVTVALTIAIAEFYLGRSPTVGEVLRRTFGIITPILGTFLLTALALIGGFLLLIVPGIYLILSFYLVTTVAALEKVYGTHALRRSRDLMSGNLWRAIGIFVLAWIAVMVLGSGFGFALGLVPWLVPLGSGLSQSVTTAFITAVTVVLYFDIRCRKEAFDLAHLATLVDGDESSELVRASA